MTSVFHHPCANSKLYFYILQFSVMRKALIICLLLGLSFMVKGQSTALPTVDIPYKKFTLDNGLTLIVHEDHKAPIVAVNVWYHVGSKNELPGKSGFAHLFEHLMFNGSENYNHDYFKVMESIGATDLNGTTSEDRTNYFQNVPVSALDQVLWLESDRMGHFLGVVDSARLEEQRGVVQNEKRQYENEPYAIAWELTTKSTYPAGHPYSWTVIGSMEDLNAASLDDVKKWFQTYYGPNNAVLVLAGDITADTALAKVKKYFGHIPPGPPISKHQEWIAKLQGHHRQVAQDRVPQVRLQKTWNFAPWGTKDAAHMILLANILTEGKSSRLYKRLVYTDELASAVFNYLDTREISSQLHLIADLRTGVDVAKVEKIVDEELNKLLNEGVTEAELQRAKMSYFSNFVKGAERIGGFGGKSDILAQCEVYGGSPDYYKKTLAWLQAATVADIKQLANKWLGEGSYVLVIHPYPELKATTADVDRKSLPPLGEDPQVVFNDMKQFTLANGLKVVLAPRKGIPLINMRLLLDGGYAADPPAKAGLTKLSMNTLMEGTKIRSALQISDELASLGASLNMDSRLDYSMVSMKALKPNLDKSLALLADVVLHPTFPEKGFNRLKAEQVLAIKQEESHPLWMGVRLLPALLYGEGHAYNKPFTGSGYINTVNGIERNDLIQYHQTWFAPNAAQLLVVGDISAEELKAKLERTFSGWQQKPVPQKNIATVPSSTKPKVFLIDKPDAIQSTILTGDLAPTMGSSDWLNMEMMNRIIGGEFTSRINMNLREDKHWSYGAGTVLLGAKGQSLYVAYAPVQSDKTKEAVVELKRELEEYVDKKPATAEEFNKVQRNAVLQLPGSWETSDAIVGALEEMVVYNRGEDYWPKYAQKVRTLTVSDIQKAAQNVVRPKQQTWVIVGDRKKIEKGIRELNLGEVHFINVEGKEAKGF